jgi:hypothetical protein
MSTSDVATRVNGLAVGDLSHFQSLLTTLHMVGAHVQLAALAERIARDMPLDNPSFVAEILETFHDVDAKHGKAILLERLPAAGLFNLFTSAGDHRVRFRYGRKPDTTPADSWKWTDLE